MASHHENKKESSKIVSFIFWGAPNQSMNIIQVNQDQPKPRLDVFQCCPCLQRGKTGVCCLKGKVHSWGIRHVLYSKKN